MKYLFPLIFLATQATAETPMTGDQFERFVEGRTMIFGLEGSAPYGVERYLSDRRVVWTFLSDNVCQPGVWYEKEDQICFEYDFDPEPQCWQFFDDPSGLRAIFMSDPPTEIRYVAQDGGELVCANFGS